MKNFSEINRAFMAKKRIVMILMAVALIALPTMAQQQEWKSTSTMPGVSSTFSPNVQEVGAKYVPSMATTTTDTYTPATTPGGPRRGFDTGAESGQSTESPIGDAVLPMLLCAAVFCGVIALRRKRSAYK